MHSKLLHLESLRHFIDGGTLEPANKVRGVAAAYHWVYVKPQVSGISLEGLYAVDIAVVCLAIDSFGNVIVNFRAGSADLAHGLTG